MRKYIDSQVIYNKNIKTKEEWLIVRKNGIGGSDAASVVGLNPYKSAVSVYLDKTTEEIKEEKNYKMELGQKLENFVAREFARLTGKKVRNVNGILKNNKYPFAIANIDKAVVGEKAFLECQVTNSYSKKEWREQPPIHCQIQCHHYMGVTGATHCYIAALVGNEELIIYKLDRDEEVIEDIMKKEETFWNEYILGEQIPDPDGSEDYSMFLKEKYKEFKDESLIIFMKEDKLSRHSEVTSLIKDLEIEKKAIEQHIQNEMKEYEIAYIGDKKITWKSQSRSSLDTKRLKKEHPEIADQYMKTTTSRVFKI
jgi:putative phage-type endonuclease